MAINFHPSSEESDFKSLPDLPAADDAHEAELRKRFNEVAAENGVTDPKVQEDQYKRMRRVQMYIGALAVASSSVSDEDSLREYRSLIHEVTQIEHTELELLIGALITAYVEAVKKGAI